MLKYKKGFVGIAVIVIAVIVVLFFAFILMRPLGGKKLPNNKISEFVCEKQIQCYFSVPFDSINAVATNDKCRYCYPSGCTHEYYYGPYLERGSYLEGGSVLGSDFYKHETEEIEKRIEKSYSPECEYEIEIIQRDKSKGTCHCGSLITM